MNDFSFIWEAALPLIEEETNPVGYKTWILALKPVKLTQSPDTAVFHVPNTLVQSMVVKRYTELIVNSLYEVSGTYYSLEVLVENEEKSEKAEEKTSSKEEKQPVRSMFKYTFDTFVVGNSNRFSHAAALAVAEAPALNYNPLFLYGGVGLGKTHLLHAIGNHIIQNNPSLNVLYTTSETFTNELINAIKNKTNDEFKNKYRSIDVLMIDDIQFIAGKKLTEEEFFHTFNTLYEENKQIIITSDRPPKEIKTLEERLKSRFEWGLMGDLYSPDFETRVAILKQKAQTDNKGNVPDEIIMHIAEKITSNIRELEGVFNRVLAYQSLVGGEITMDIVENVIKVYEDNSHKFVNENTIIKAVSEYYGVSIDDIMSDKRPKEIAETRQITMYLLREILGLSHLKIGKILNKDHTTVMHGIKKVDFNIKKDSDFGDTLNSLIKDIKG